MDDCNGQPTRRNMGSRKRFIGFNPLSTENYFTTTESIPVYYGFTVLDDVEVEGFKFGKTTEFEVGPNVTYGDAFVVAPDGSRAGLVWEVSKENETYFEEVFPLASNRWGVWAVSFPYPMRNREDARRNLQAVLPELKEKWSEWQRQFKVVPKVEL